MHVPNADGEVGALQVLRYGPEHENGLLPAVLLFHGGSWQKGGPRQLSPYATEFADAGYVAYSAEYRLLGKNTDSVEDCVADAEAVYQWLVEHAEEEGIDVSRMFVGGASAGGHLALCVFLKLNEVGACRFQGYIGYNPVVTTQSERFESLFEDFGVKYDPIAKLSNSAAPMLILHGSEDPVVPMDSVRSFQRKAEAFGVSCKLEVFDGETHGFFNQNRASAEVRERLEAVALEFLSAHN
ncbi:alpha/beta hydrolase [Thalassobacterium sedimentorum]|uniref:alpha/beta hydrolase n=1 Tax=Thalassobacterium sedimentorum TaxID=3041258 RepID=UPI002810D4E6|nr:alpha/beta hydrolase [Coraliomargarita sp. SDUM461004]